MGACVSNPLPDFRLTFQADLDNTQNLLRRSWWSETHLFLEVEGPLLMESGPAQLAGGAVTLLSLLGPGTGARASQTSVVRLWQGVNSIRILI